MEQFIVWFNTKMGLIKIIITNVPIMIKLQFSYISVIWPISNRMQ